MDLKLFTKEQNLFNNEKTKENENMKQNLT